MRVGAVIGACVGLLGVAVLGLGHLAGLPVTGRALVAALTAGLATAAFRLRRSDPWPARAAESAAAGLGAMVLLLWLLPLHSASSACGSVLAPAEAWGDREGVCAWIAGRAYDATLPALALAALFTLGSALATGRSVSGPSGRPWERAGSWLRG